jgi:hypothetical protein
MVDIMNIRKEHPLFAAVAGKVCDISWEIYYLIGDDENPRKATKAERDEANKLTDTKAMVTGQAERMLKEMHTLKLGAQSVSLP